MSSILLTKSGNMGSSSPIFHEFRRQASFFFKEKIKTARLALTDVTPAELLTEEAINGDIWPPDTKTMGVISRAAFEVDDYWRIVDIIHKRLIKFERENWRVHYKALLVLEHFLTHGPLRVADEFQCDKDVIKDIGFFLFVDERGFNWGTSVRNLTERILKLLEDGVFLKEERARCRKLTRGIHGFGSFTSKLPSPNDNSNDGSFKGLPSKACTRSNSYYNDHQDSEFLDANEELLKEYNAENPKPTRAIKKYRNVEDDHPFLDKDDRNSKVYLLSKED